MMMRSFHIPRGHSHFCWNNALSPVATVNSGDTIRLEVANSSGGQVHRDSRAEDLAGLDFDRVNPVTGPIYVNGAEPGDALMVELLAIDLGAWGWTGNIPGFGLLADYFEQPHLRISEVGETAAELLPGLRVPVVPLVGSIGLAPSELGDHSILPPRRVGGTMNIRHVTPGARLWLPVAVPGALLSVGDTHAAQGDGEVCGTAIEVDSEVTLRVHLVKQRQLNFPMVEAHPSSARKGLAIITTGMGPDLYEAARQATLGMIEEVVDRTGLDELDAYLVTSVAGDLKISEIVDQPNWIVSMHLEKDILAGAP
jgi:acetamidase/formamidase